MELIYPASRMKDQCWLVSVAVEAMKTAKMNAKDITAYYVQNRHILILILRVAHGTRLDMESGYIVKREPLPLDIVDQEEKRNVVERTGTLYNVAR